MTPFLKTLFEIDTTLAQVPVPTVTSDAESKYHKEYVLLVPNVFTIDSDEMPHAPVPPPSVRIVFTGHKSTKDFNSFVYILPILQTQDHHHELPVNE